MTRKALIVGIDHYENGHHLFGCVNDALAVEQVLARHGTGARNFGTTVLTASGPDDAVQRSQLRAMVKALFSGTGDICLLYFAGHGHIEASGGYLQASDDGTDDPGLPINDILAWADESNWTNRVIVLDSCHSGIAADASPTNPVAGLRSGTTILAASTADQYASEENGSGVFTGLFVDALEGAAADLVGNITPGSVYAHVDQSLGEWDQRPVFKTNVQRFVSLRTVNERVDVADLRRLPDLFPDPTGHFALDPSFEPRDEGRTADMPASDPANTETFRVLQSFNRVGLLVPVDADHMWNAAMESTACKLTSLGRHYHRLAARHLI